MFFGMSFTQINAVKPTKTKWQGTRKNYVVGRYKTLPYCQLYLYCIHFACAIEAFCLVHYSVTDIFKGFTVWILYKLFLLNNIYKVYSLEFLLAIFCNILLRILYQIFLCKYFPNLILIFLFFQSVLLLLQLLF